MTQFELTLAVSIIGMISILHANTLISSRLNFIYRQLIHLNFILMYCLVSLEMFVDLIVPLFDH